MGLKDFFKKGRRTKGFEAGGLEIPTAPPSKEELPTFPTPEDIPEIRERESPKKRVASPLERAEEYAVRLQREELEEREDLKLKKPIFVYLESYKEMMNEVSLIQTTLKEGADSLVRVTEFKEDEDKEFNKWESTIKDIQRKLTYVDKTLFASQK